MTDPSRRPATARPILLGLVVALALAACGGARPSSGSNASPPPGNEAGEPPAAASAAPMATPVSSDPAGGSVPLDPSTPISCHGLAEADCLRALGAALASLPNAGGGIRYAEVGPFWCPANPGCETSLVARPNGRVFLEPASGDPVELQVELTADGTLAATRGEAFTVLVEPSSPATGIGGPIEFELGHCGLLSGVDLDGSWWDPVGYVNSEHGDAINAAHGVVAFQGPNQATFTSDGGLVVALVRRAGAKHLPMCM